VTGRRPAVLAKIAAAAGHGGGGRLPPGAGAGWQQNEHAAYGIALGTARERMDRFEEAVQILRLLPGRPRTTFPGRYFQLQQAPGQPAPVQGRLPLLAGGGGQRTLRIAARCAGQRNPGPRPRCSRARSRCRTGTVGKPAATPARSMSPPRRCRTCPPATKGSGEKRPARPPRPAIAGTPGEVTAIIARYQHADADQLIIPDATPGPMARKNTPATCSRSKPRPPSADIRRTSPQPARPDQPAHLTSPPARHRSPGIKRPPPCRFGGFASGFDVTIGDFGDARWAIRLAGSGPGGCVPAGRCLTWRPLGDVGSDDVSSVPVAAHRQPGR